MYSSAVLQPIADRLKVELRALQAVFTVESAGSPRSVHGPTIRLEVHNFWKGCTDEQRPAIEARFHVEGPQPWEGHKFLDTDGAWHALHRDGRQDREWRAFRVAEGINPTEAVECTSWGAGQVCGDWKGLGFASPAAFVEAQATDDGQIDTVVRYLERVKPQALVALRAKKWYSFAYYYNGAGKPKAYEKQLRAAYAAHK